jgi:hypothetical protein
MDAGLAVGMASKSRGFLGWRVKESSPWQQGADRIGAAASTVVAVPVRFFSLRARREAHRPARDFRVLGPLCALKQRLRRDSQTAIEVGQASACGGLQSASGGGQILNLQADSQSARCLSSNMASERSQSAHPFPKRYSRRSTRQEGFGNRYIREILISEVNYIMTEFLVDNHIDFGHVIRTVFNCLKTRRE